MDTVNIKLKKEKKKLEKNELEKLSKEELIEKLLCTEAHNVQLKNILTRNISNTAKNSKKQKVFNFSRTNFRHIFLNFFYFGWDYQGFVTQEDTNNTIEFYLFEALIKTCLIKDRESSNYHRCGRTDKGVSSFGQVISINVRSKLSKDKQHKLNEELNYCKMLNRILPENIQCIRWSPVPEDFSARFNCKSRTYKYFFPRGNLNIKAMEKSLPYLIGTHDFRNLCKMDVANGVVNFIRNISEITIKKCQNHSDDNPYTMYELTIKSQAFLWHQIRCIVAVLFLIGDKKEEPEIIQQLLDIEKNPRKPDYNMALDVPLNLFYCEYEIDDWIYDYSTLSNVISTIHRQWTLSSIKTTMMKSMLDDLESKFDSEQFEERKYFNNLTSCLLQGVKSKVYKPLMERQKCESLEDKIQHYIKKRKLITTCDEESTSKNEFII